MGISIWQLLIVLAIVIVLFGTKKLRNIGADLGGAIKNFRSAVRDGESEEKPATGAPGQLGKSEQGAVIEGQVSREKDKT